MEVYIILGVLILMVIAMISDKFEFGFAPMAACVILAMLGIVTVQEAFAGFTNNYVIVTAGFLVLSNLFSRTRLIAKVQDTVTKMQQGKSGTMLFLVLILFVFVLSMFMEPGPTALLVCILLTSIPDNGRISNSQMLLPLGAMCNLSGRKVPIGVTLMFVMWVNGFLEKAGFHGSISAGAWVLMGLIPLILAVVYSLFAYRMLPKHTLNMEANQKSESGSTELLSNRDEILVYIIFGVCTLAMFVSNQLGGIVYIMPIIGIGILCICGTVTFKEIRAAVSHQLIFMLAGIFALADIMANKGVTALLGKSIQNALGTAANGWVILLIFAFATVIMASLTGSNIGTMMIMAPIAVTTCMAVNIDPRAIAMAVAACSCASIMFPMDTAMGMIFARGNYKLISTLKYTVPLTALYVVTICISAALIYPF
jgi:di/tricarboxylate transporter